MKNYCLRIAGVLLLGAAAVVAEVGCAGGGAPGAGPAAAGAPEARYRVTSDTTPFYRYGPQQAGGADLSLKKGTDLLMVKRAFGYSQVKTMDTQQVGYVSTEDIAPLTQQELAAIAAINRGSTPVTSVGGPGKKSRAIVGEYTLPMPGAPGAGAGVGAGAPDTLPMPESTATPPPNNMFRY